MQVSRAHASSQTFEKQLSIVAVSVVAWEVLLNVTSNSQVTFPALLLASAVMLFFNKKKSDDLISNG